MTVNSQRLTSNIQTPADRDVLRYWFQFMILSKKWRPEATWHPLVERFLRPKESFEQWVQRVRKLIHLGPEPVLSLGPPSALSLQNWADGVTAAGDPISAYEVLLIDLRSQKEEILRRVRSRLDAVPTQASEKTGFDAPVFALNGRVTAASIRTTFRIAQSERLAKDKEANSKAIYAQFFSGNASSPESMHVEVSRRRKLARELLESGVPEGRFPNPKMAPGGRFMSMSADEIDALLEG